MHEKQRYYRFFDPMRGGRYFSESAKALHALDPAVKIPLELLKVYGLHLGAFISFLLTHEYVHLDPPMNGCRFTCPAKLIESQLGLTQKQQERLFFKLTRRGIVKLDLNEAGQSRWVTINHKVILNTLKAARETRAE